jgi:hypothetical protein
MNGLLCQEAIVVNSSSTPPKRPFQAKGGYFRRKGDFTAAPSLSSDSNFDHEIQKLAPCRLMAMPSLKSRHGVNRIAMTVVTGRRSKDMITAHFTT